MGGEHLPAGRSVSAMRTTSHHITRYTAIALVAGAAMAPVAAAQQDLRSPDARDAALRPENTQDLRSADAREAARQAELPQDLRLPDTRDGAEGRGLETAPIVEFVEVAETNGFDWADAGLGAAAGIGLVLVGVGGAMTSARLRRRPIGSAQA
jgi:hypothetical protein